ncbi:ABC transporter permease [Kaistia terrae]|uniref:Autoinducer 2 import system permease protein LsrC n=1 Tax=Kaistia terrae TaxID=537017 RepID=A0ABW0Q2V3_9HYPH|nr:ABC transporter permease [Kaistia terrae]MCX5581539.1 ABC transporter permease [Kaistia terrae]
MNGLRLRPERVRELSLLAIIAIAVLVFATIIDGYLSPRTFNRIASSVIIIAVVAAGQTLVVLTRNIDLSVGAMVGCVAYFTGALLAANHGLPPVLAIALAVAIGTLMGAVNGALVVFARIPSIIVTLGTMAVFRGLLVEFSGAKSITTANLPSWLVNLPQMTVLSIGSFDVRAMVALALVTIILFQIGMSVLRVGRHFYAVGSNPDAAHFTGLPVRRVIFSAFLLSGAMSGLAGFMTLARFGTITVEAAMGLELESIAAVVVGGVNIFGGAGSIIGATLGAILIGTLEQSLFRLQINQFWLDALLGLLILVAVASDSVLITRLRKFWNEARAKRRRLPAATDTPS